MIFDLNTMFLIDFPEYLIHKPFSYSLIPKYKNKKSCHLKLIVSECTKRA